jgi:hypothetical protein
MTPELDAGREKSPSRWQIVWISAASALLAACASPPQSDELIFAKVTRIFSEADYRNAFERGRIEQGFFGQNDFSMLEAAIKSGVGHDAVKERRLIACECSCGTECYASYPLLLPEGVVIHLGDLIKLKAGTSKWEQGLQRFTYTLGQYQQQLDIPSSNWTRIEGNHGLLPACDPAKWRS